MDLLTFIFMVLCIVFAFMNKYIGAVFLMSLFNVLFLMFRVVLNKNQHLTTMGAIELTVSIMALIYSILAVFCNINIISILFK